MAFKDQRDGWVTVAQLVPGKAILYTTHDGGTTWTPVALPSPATADPATYQSSAPPVILGSTIVVAVQSGEPNGDPSVIFYVSNDGGVTWRTSKDLLSNTHRPFTEAFADAAHGWLSDGLRYYVTHDAGLSWKLLGLKTLALVQGDLQQLDFVSPALGWALIDDAKGSRILETEDGGLSWFAIAR